MRVVEHSVVLLILTWNATFSNAFPMIQHRYRSSAGDYAHLSSTLSSLATAASRGKKKNFVLTRLNQASTAMDSDASFPEEDKKEQGNQSTTSTSSNTIAPAAAGKKQGPLELPWGQRQKWALRDNVHKYTVDIPQLADGVVSNKGVVSGLSSDTYVMWRALTRDVMELAGYDVEFIRSKYVETMRGEEHESPPSPSSSSSLQGQPKEDNNNVHENDSIVVPGVLPLLDQFEFQSNGGISGKIQGLRGIADGTTIQTSPLAHIQLTIPRGYVLTEDGSSAYELGIPKTSVEEQVLGYSLDLAKLKMGSTSKSVYDDVVPNLMRGWENGMNRNDGRAAVNVSDPETTDMLVNLGATTAILLGGATAVNLLSHHLTVNVFWV